MRRLALTHRAVLNAPLARDVVGRAGDALARSGHLVTERVVRALQQRGITSVYVEDLASAGIVLAGIAPPAVTAPVQGLLAEFFARVQRAVEPVANQPAPLIVEALRGPTSPVASLRVNSLLSEIRNAAGVMAKTCAEADGRTGYLTDRAPDDDLIGHSLQVAALAARIAAALGFTDEALTGVAFGALLHDAGLVFVPVDIRTSPDRWTVPQRLRHQDHTVLGEALLAAVARSYPALPAVAAEHHEAQDGSGFPLGKRGGNRVLRSAERERALNYLSLPSEVIAVADRYERLVSPGPGHPGLPPAEARYTLSSEAGTKLNAEVVARFLDTFPALPVGTEVRIAGGEYDGSRGIVTRPPSAARPKPQVRVYADRTGEPHTPVDVDLARFRDASALLDEGRAA